MKSIEAREVVAVGADQNQLVLPSAEFRAAVAESLTGEKEKILGRYFTNLDGDVRAIKGAMPPVVAAALVARFSRAPEPDITQLFWEEFVSDPSMGALLVQGHLIEEDDMDEVLASEHARKLIKRIIDGFGDDSVREAASGHIVVEGASVLTAMEAFQHPLITGIEASTRYIDWREKDKSGRYRYAHPDRVLKSSGAELYVSTVDNLFETYTELWQPVWDLVVAKNPKPEKMSDTAYEGAVRGRVCDNLRKLLPLGSKTNFGVHANYRALSEMSMNLQASESLETFRLGEEMAEQLSLVNPEFIAVAKNERGAEWATHRFETQKAIQDFGRRVIYQATPDTSPAVDVRVLNENYLLDVAAALLSHARPEADLSNLKEEASRLIENGSLVGMLESIGRARTNRRHKVPESFGVISLSARYENISFSGYKDLNRHRRITDKTPPDFSANRGFYTPDELQELGGKYLQMYNDAQNRAIEAYSKLTPKVGTDSRLVLTHGTKTAFAVTMGLAEAIWINELRSMASGDPEYRRFAQECARKVNDLMPELGVVRSFVDYKEYPLGRIGEAVRADLRGLLAT